MKALVIGTVLGFSILNLTHGGWAYADEDKRADSTQQGVTSSPAEEAAPTGLAAEVVGQDNQENNSETKMADKSEGTKGSGSDEVKQDDLKFPGGRLANGN